MSEGCILLSRSLMQVIQQCLFTDNPSFFIHVGRAILCHMEGSFKMTKMKVWSMIFFIRASEGQNINSFAYPMSPVVSKGMFQNLILKGSYLLWMHPNQPAHWKNVPIHTFYSLNHQQLLFLFTQIMITSVDYRLIKTIFMWFLA